MPFHTVEFLAGPGAILRPGRVRARDGRSAAWMAAAAATATSSQSTVVALSEWDFRQACDAAHGHALRCMLEVGGRVISENIFLPERRPVVRWGEQPATPNPTVERIGMEIAAALGEPAVVCIDAESPIGSSVERAIRGAPDGTVHTVLSRPSRARGSGVASAIGIACVTPNVPVVAVLDADSASVGAADLESAAEAGVRIALVIINDRLDPAPYERLAALAGGHGESVHDLSKAALHLRNAVASPLCAVVNICTSPARILTRA